MKVEFSNISDLIRRILFLILLILGTNLTFAFSLQIESRFDIDNFKYSVSTENTHSNQINVNYFSDIYSSFSQVHKPENALCRSSFCLAAKGGKWVYGGFKSSTKWANQLSKRGWTPKQISEAISKGKQFNTVNMVNNVNKANSATIFVHPTTGQSVVIDNVTNELLHVGGKGFKY